VDVFEVLADPVRRSLLTEVAAAPARVSDLAASRPVSRPAVSRHLRLLLEAGVVSVEDHGRERRYAFVPGSLDPVTAYAASLGPQPLDRSLEHALDALDTEVRRTTRDRRRARPHPTRHEETA
jgi:DNA-binding transcriptional ArsR family regulator